MVRMADSQNLRFESRHRIPYWGSMTDLTVRGIPLRTFTPPVPVSPRSQVQLQQPRRCSSTRQHLGQQRDGKQLTHVSVSGSAHMVSISDKIPSKRVAKAVCSVRFTNKTACQLVRENQIQKGDVLGVARVAGIMAAKRTSDLIPLCHPIALSKVTVDLKIVQGQDQDEGQDHFDRVDIEATVACEGKTGVEMEALTAASTAALTIYDMCKAVDKGMIIEGLRVVLKEGGKSGRWVEGMQDGLPSIEN